jgi:hypothetical protein
MTEIDIPEAAYENAAKVVLELAQVAPSDAYEIASEVLQAGASAILIAELGRLIEDPNSYDEAGSFRPTMLINRISELRKAGEQW